MMQSNRVTSVVIIYRLYRLYRRTIVVAVCAVCGLIFRGFVSICIDRLPPLKTLPGMLPQPDGHLMWA